MLKRRGRLPARAGGRRAIGVLFFARRRAGRGLPGLGLRLDEKGRRGRAANSPRPRRYKVIGKNGATVRAEESLESEQVDKVALDDTVLVIEESADKSRVKIDDPEGWISSKLLLPYSVKQTKEGWKGDIQEVQGGDDFGCNLKKEDYDDPTNLTMESMKEDLRLRYEAEGVDFS